MEFIVIVLLCLYAVVQKFIFSPGDPDNRGMTGIYHEGKGDQEEWEWHELFASLKKHKSFSDFFPAFNLHPKGMDTWMGLFVGTKMIGNYTFAYMCHTNVVTTCRDMMNQDDATLKKVSFMNVAFAFTGYTVVMCAVFFTFGIVLT